MERFNRGLRNPMTAKPPYLQTLYPPYPPYTTYPDVCQTIVWALYRLKQPLSSPAWGKLSNLRNLFLPNLSEK